MLGAARLAPGLRVLDVACGVGEPALEAARRVRPRGAVVATDLLPEMVEATREAARAEGLDNVECVLAAAEAPPPGPFDAVTCRFGLMFFSDAVAAIEGWRRVARPGARIVAAVWAGPDQNPFMGIRTRVAREVLGSELPPLGPGQESLAVPGALAATLQAAGLKSVAVETVPLRWEAPDARTWVAMMTELSPPLAEALHGASPATASSFLAELARAVSPYAGASGRVSVPASSLVGFGEA